MSDHTFDNIARMLETEALRRIQKSIHQTAVEKGWHTPPERSLPEAICLMHSELSEALEAYRTDTMDNHLPHRSGVAVEFADCIIRILDTAEQEGIDVIGALFDKMDFNLTRPYRHGGKKC